VEDIAPGWMCLLLVVGWLAVGLEWTWFERVGLSKDGVGV